jgi:lipoprotein-anchoring transpeptidase ErfK/SrfK
VISRVRHELQILDENREVLRTFSVGIGRGGLKVKRSMSDYVTPTGEFRVDLVLSRDPELNAISPESRERFGIDPRFRELTRDQHALYRLFENMSSIDFNRDGAPDHAYGAAYIGLDSESAVTGPKMTLFGDTPYWYSIALHGTPNPATDLGRSNSGGCIHLPENELLELIRSKRVQIGTVVRIVD